jgi:hypothetical protein
MNRRTFNMATASTPSLLLSACGQSEKIVRWDEEVLLNTGETIWVKRADIFVKGAEPGNPLQRTWKLDRRAYEFTWQGQKYIYTTEVKLSPGALLIYVHDASKTISIVDFNRECIKPGYGEFRWVNGNWQLQQNVAPALIGQVRNLMGSFDSEGEIPAQVNRAFKQQIDTAPNRSKKIMQIDESNLATNCTRIK